MEYTFHWEVVYHFRYELGLGILTTVHVVLWSLLISLTAGLIVGSCRLSKQHWLALAGGAYADFFRITPELILIFWVYYCIPITLGIGISSFVSGVVALSLIGTAYAAEIFRAGFQAVPRGHVHAARSLGMSSFQTNRTIVLPQAVRIMLPPFMNFFADLLKTSSLLAPIAVTELMYRGSELNMETFRPFEAFTAVAIVYFVMIYPISMGVRRVERRLALRL